MNNRLNLTKEQMVIWKDVKKRNSPKNIIIRSVLKDLSETRDRVERLEEMLEFDKPFVVCHRYDCKNEAEFEGWLDGAAITRKIKVCGEHVWLTKAGQAKIKAES